MVKARPVGEDIADIDPLDSEVSGAGATGTTTMARRRLRWPSRWRLALGLSPTPGPGLVLVLLGMAIGPRGLGLLTQSALGSLDPAVSVAIAALGVFVGLDIRVRGPREDRLLAAASLEAATTILLVAAGMLIIYPPSSFFPPGFPPSPGLLAVSLGICAAASSMPVASSMQAGRSVAQRIGDLDDVLPIVLGMFVLAWARQGTPATLVAVVAQAIAIALMVALAAWLLVRQTSSESEQRVFAMGALLLLGGAAAHLSLSALTLGLVAGAFWNAAGTPALDALTRDMRYLQHPLMALLLIVAGSRVRLSADLASFAIAYVVLRTAGKLAGGWLATVVVARELPRDLGFSFTSPGIVGIAFALNMLQARGELDAATTAFTIVVAGSLGSELFSLSTSRRERSA